LVVGNIVSWKSIFFLHIGSLIHNNGVGI